MPEHRLHFFLYPSAAAANRAAVLWEDMRRGCRDPSRTARMPPERMHVTLQPLGAFQGHSPPRDVVERATAVGDAVDDEPFDVLFDFVQCRASAAVPGTLELQGRGPALRRLRGFQRGLVDGLRRSGFAEERLRIHFTPHMTLDYAHPQVARRLLEPPITWRVTELCLVDSLHGQGRHEVLERWPLRPRQQVFSGWEFDVRPGCS